MEDWQKTSHSFSDERSVQVVFAGFRKLKIPLFTQKTKRENEI